MLHIPPETGTCRCPRLRPDAELPACRVTETVVASPKVDPPAPLNVGCGVAVVSGPDPGESSVTWAAVVFTLTVTGALRAGRGSSCSAWAVYVPSGSAALAGTL